jgi:hypothetical protein
VGASTDAETGAGPDREAEFERCSSDPTRLRLIPRRQIVSRSLASCKRYPRRPGQREEQGPFAHGPGGEIPVSLLLLKTVEQSDVTGEWHLMTWPNGGRPLVTSAP